MVVRDALPRGGVPTSAAQLPRWWLANQHIPRATIVEIIVEFVWNGVQPLLNESDAR
jgi:hypothetical protein